MMYGGTAYYMLNTEKKKKELPNSKEATKLFAVVCATFCILCLVICIIV